MIPMTMKFGMIPMTYVSFCWLIYGIQILPIKKSRILYKCFKMQDDKVGGVDKEEDDDDNNNNSFVRKNP